MANMDLSQFILLVTASAAVQVIGFFLVKRHMKADMDNKMRRNNLYGENN